MRELKPCPFCGGAEITPHAQYYADPVCDCRTCGAIGPLTPVQDRYTWDTRPTEETQQADIAELLKALREHQKLIRMGHPAFVAGYNAGGLCERTDAILSKHEARDA